MPGVGPSLAARALATDAPVAHSSAPPITPMPVASWLGSPALGETVPGSAGAGAGVSSGEGTVGSLGVGAPGSVGDGTVGSDGFGASGS